MKKNIANLFKALSDENRLLIFERLIQGETCGCTLLNNMPITQPTLSYHLRLLSDSGLITAHKEGVWKKHHVDYEKLDALIDYLVSLKSMKGQCSND